MIEAPASVDADGRPTVADDPSAPSSPPVQRVWVRRCARCRGHDLYAAFGRPGHIDDRPWSCRGCGSSDWVPACLEIPDAVDGGRCPMQGGQRP